MVRIALRALAFSAFAAAVATTALAQQANAPDRVYYIDKKDGSIRDLEATVKASPTGYQITPINDKKVITVSAADLVRVVPGNIPGYERAAIMEPVSLETKKEWEKARIGHAEMLKKATGAPEKVRKYLEFRQAICAAHAADEVADDAAASAKTEEAVRLLESFLVVNKTGWDVWPVGPTCARLQITSHERKKDGDKESEGRRLFDEAARSWGKVARAADLSPDLRLEAALQEIDLKIRARLFADARGLIDDAMKTAPAGAAKDRLAIYQLAVKFGDTTTPLAGKDPIEAEIAKTKDAHVRAAGYGMLGELYLIADKPREAMWQFLWVEVVYNQDREEVIKALARLSDAFRLQGDEEKSKSFREKARRMRGGA